jgi:hypothetical protein
MTKYLLLVSFLCSFLFAKEFIINTNGQIPYETQTIKLNFEIDDEGKLIPQQKYDVRNLKKPNSLKIITAPGLKGTLKDEREVVVYYKTSLDVSGLKIRNLYKVGHTRVYGEENNITITFDTDHYQNIVSYLRYHNINNETIKDINNMYGTWEEIE